jgi:hypothetical protein
MKENKKLKEEVERLKRDLIQLKGKCNSQPSQDNREYMVKKLEKGSTEESSWELRTSQTCQTITKRMTEFRPSK